METAAENIYETHTNIKQNYEYNLGVSEKYRFEVLENYFKEKGIVRHQLDTFNDYINNGIQRVVKENDVIIATKEQKYTITFGDVYIPSPSVIEEDRSVRIIYPDEARRRDLTYDSPIFVDVTEKIEIEGRDPEINIHRRVIIGRTPIMLRSDKCNLKNLTQKERVENGECNWDQGGYFIIRGKERVLVGQIRGIYNQPIILHQKAGEKYKYVCETRSMSEETGHSVLIQAKIGSDDRTIVFSLPNIKEHIPVGIVFKALGFASAEEITNIIGLYDDKTQKYIKYIIRDSYFITNQEDALKYIGEFSMHVIKEDKKADYALQIVENELLPHMGVTSTIKEKVYFLGNMVNKLIRTHIGLRNEDDRDNYANKRVEMAGVLCCDLFRALFKRFIKTIQGQLEKKKQHPDILSIISRISSITLGLKYSFCFPAGTMISMSNGLSYPIETLADNTNKIEKVIGWDDGLIVAKHGGLMEQGVQDTVRLTFEDGRTLTCTPDHKILTIDDNNKTEWIEAKDIKMDTKIIQGIENPHDIIDYNLDWNLTFTIDDQTTTWNIKNKLDRNKILAFSRISGYIIGDGHLPKNTTNQAVIYFGHMFDVNSFIDDYKLLVDNKKPKIRDDYSEKWGKSFSLNLCNTLTKMLRSIGIVSGKKVNQKREFPNFIMENNCPNSVIREFLGGLFGADGHSPKLDIRKNKRTSIVNVGFSWTTDKDNIDNLKNTFSHLEYLLKKFNVDSYTNGPYSKNSQDKFELELHTEINTNFFKNIGFRYCIHKTYKSNVIYSYLRMIEKIKEQHNFVIKKVDELKNTKDMILDNALKHAHDELKNKEYIMNDYYSLPNIKIVRKIREAGRSKSLENIEEKYGVLDAVEYIKSINGWYMFENDYICDRNLTTLPYFTLKLKDRRNDKPCIVYDIMNVEKCHSFLANGLIVSNCVGNWGIQKNNYIRSGVSQVLSRMTHGAFISHLRRLVIPIGKEGKNAKIRQIHPSQIMYICNCECFDPETPILLWNGNIKAAKDIRVGDILIDENGNQTKVRKTIYGTAPMYEVDCEKTNFLKHTVTSNHILTLKIREHNVVRHVKTKNPYFIVKYFDKNELTIKSKSFKTENDAKIFSKEIENKYDDILDISISEYNKLSDNTKKHLVIFKCKEIQWPKKDVSLDPYILGIWLGDGNSDGSRFTSEDPELVEEWAEQNNTKITLKPLILTEKDKKYTYHLHQKSDSEKYRPDICYAIENSTLRHSLIKYNLLNNKHIPIEYLTNDRETRLKVLAGLIDTDGNVRANGHEVRIVQGPKNYKIIEDALLLSESLGFCCHLNSGKSQWTHYFDDDTSEKRYGEYKELTITGEYLYEIPTKLPRKKLNKFDSETTSSFMQSKFSLKEKGLGDFVGWQLEGNGRFLLSDCTVSHNTPEGQSIGIVLNLALLTTVSRRIPTIVVKEIIENSENLIFINDYDGINDKAKVFLNGILMGFAIDSQDFIDEIKIFRSSGMLHQDVSFTYDKLDNEIRIFCDEGRLIRPVFTVNEDNKLNITENDPPIWDQLVEKKLIQYVDNSEVENSVIAMDNNDLNKFKCNFQEIHPCTMLGVMASSIPFPDHSQCIEKDEPVYMADGSIKKICDVEIGDKVITFDPESQKQSITTVTHTETHPTEKQLFTIYTTSGRKISATFDHRFMTSEGWKRLEHLKKNHSLIGVSLEPKPLSCIVEVFCIIPKNSKTLGNSFDHFLPLKSNFIYLPILSRIIGYTFNYEVNINDEGEHTIILEFNTENDQISFEEDLTLLKLQYIKIQLSKNKILYEGSFPFLVSLLNKQNDYLIPDWIMNGSKLVKREFLATLSNKIISEQIQNLYDYLNLKQIDDFKLSFRFSLDQNSINFIKHFENINVRYNINKQIEYGKIVEYLKYVDFQHKKYSEHIPVDYEMWCKRIKVKSKTLFVPIHSIDKCDKNIISDITVDSKNQSFLCGDTFCVHNSPRNIYQSSMGKQAIGIFAQSHQIRTDTIVHVLDYPQKPLVNTKPADFLGFNDMPSGINAIVAIACYSGFKY